MLIFHKITNIFISNKLAKFKAMSFFSLLQYILWKTLHEWSTSKCHAFSSQILMLNRRKLVEIYIFTIEKQISSKISTYIKPQPRKMFVGLGLVLRLTLENVLVFAFFPQIKTLFFVIFKELF